ncbi:MAG: hypothetical protein JWN39_1094 [Ilumatobacteraceae bacterium]|nr:hypothetical protein [Ilumatobacteraceae bacterium]
MPFTGFPPTAVEFFDGLADDNSKEFWAANKAVYDQDVKAPMLALLDELGGFGTFRLFRPYNDVRFARGRPPYKEQIGALGRAEGGCVFYVQLSASGLRVGTGIFHMATDQLERFRVAVDDDTSGSQLDRLVAELEQRGGTITAIEELKTAPRGFPKDHPRIALLRRKGIAAMRAWDVEPWLHTKAVVKRVRDAWAEAADIDAWLDANVGPSTLPPSEFGRR